MKKVLSMLLTAAMVMGLSVPVLAGDMDGKLVVMHTNDIHGHYETTEEQLGIAGVAALKDSYEAQGAEVILLDAGDFSQGTTLVNHDKGMRAVEYLVAADYDAVSLGNHEFDFGQEAVYDMTAALKAGGISVLDANIQKKGGTEAVFGDRTIIEKGDMKIGIFGLDTAETQTKAAPSSVAGMVFLDKDEMFATAQAQVDALQAAGCDYIICICHLGVDDESIGRRSIDLAAAVKGIDVIIDGHSHTEMPSGKVVGDTLITSTGSYLANVGTIVVDMETKTETAALISAADYAADYAVYDEALAEMVAADITEINEIYEGIFAETKVDLNGERDPGVRTLETNLGDFAADAYLYAGREYVKEAGLDITVDLALANGGGIRASIPTGEISMNTLYTVFPYGNTVALVTITGEQLLEVLEASTFCTPTALGGFPQAAGVEFTVNTAVPYENGEQYPDSTYFAPANTGSRVTIHSVNGKAFDPAANYTVVVNSFQAEGGDTYYALTQGTFSHDTAIVDADALISYVNSMNGVIGKEYAEPQGRIHVVYDESAIPAEPETPVVPETPVAPEEPTAEVVTNLYKVVAGDTLWKIAKAQLGDGMKWRGIYEDNKTIIKNPNRIYIGQELVINK